MFRKMKRNPIGIVQLSVLNPSILIAEDLGIDRINSGCCKGNHEIEVTKLGIGEADRFNMERIAFDIQSACWKIILRNLACGI
jgi:hypothetical protein